MSTNKKSIFDDDESSIPVAKVSLPKSDKESSIFDDEDSPSQLQIPSPDQVVKQTTSNIDKQRGSLMGYTDSQGKQRMGLPGIMSDKMSEAFGDQAKKEMKEDAFATGGIAAGLFTGGLSEALPAATPSVIRILTSMLGQGTIPYEAGHAASNAIGKTFGDRPEPRNLMSEGLATILPGVISGMQIRGVRSQAAQALQDKLAGLKSQAESTAKNIPTNKINILKNQGALDATEVATQRKLTDLNQSIIQQKADLAKLQSQAQSGGKVMGKLYGRQADEAKQALAELTIQREQLKDPTLQAVQPQRNINSSKIRVIENQEELRQLKSQIADLEAQTPSAANKAKLTPLIKKAAVLMGLAGGGWGAAKLTHLL